MFLNSIDTSALWTLIAWAGSGIGVLVAIYVGAIVYYRNRAEVDIWLSVLEDKRRAEARRGRRHPLVSVSRRRARRVESLAGQRTH